jgi:hypothetical protein
MDRHEIILYWSAEVRCSSLKCLNCRLHGAWDTRKSIVQRKEAGLWIYRAGWRSCAGPRGRLIYA